MIISPDRQHSGVGWSASELVSPALVTADLSGISGYHPSALILSYKTPNLQDPTVHCPITLAHVKVMSLTAISQELIDNGKDMYVP